MSVVDFDEALFALGSDLLFRLDQNKKQVDVDVDGQELGLRFYLRPDLRLVVLPFRRSGVLLLLLRLLLLRIPNPNCRDDDGLMVSVTMMMMMMMRMMVLVSLDYYWQCLACGLLVTRVPAHGCCDSSSSPTTS